mmetsp:Transcript_8025/g.20653  ORF Transcript_8025/g.20653 Transcript_8025/m.20653 type:complete len:252 (-) Transcript_8025:2217-2972(-)
MQNAQCCDCECDSQSQTQTLRQSQTHWPQASILHWPQAHGRTPHVSDVSGPRSRGRGRWDRVRCRTQGGRTKSGPATLRAVGFTGLVTRLGSTRSFAQKVYVRPVLAACGTTSLAHMTYAAMVMVTGQTTSAAKFEQPTTSAVGRHQACRHPTHRRRLSPLLVQSFCRQGHPARLPQSARCGNRTPRSPHQRARAGCCAAGCARLHRAVLDGRRTRCATGSRSAPHLRPAQLWLQRRALPAAPAHARPCAA